MLTYADVCYLCVWQVIDERYVHYTERQRLEQQHMRAAQVH